MILRTEPDVLIPKLTVESNRILGAIAEFLVPYLEQHGLADGVDCREAADFLARMILSYMNAPGRWDLDDRLQVATLVRTELLAGIVAGPEPGR
jgi:AcrR family transcriptional regulator